jgi:hypothetical protein
MLPRNVGTPQSAIWRSVIKDNQDDEEILYAPTLSLPIGIGGSLATPILPHHQAYGSVAWRLDVVQCVDEPSGG